MDENKTTILVVDDEEYIRRLISRILDDAGYQVVTAASGKEALDRLADSGINLVLLDIRMPDMDGFQTLGLLRKQYSLPVIMVTGVGEVTSVSDALSIGADDYVKKPFLARELVARIEAKLRRIKRDST
ncbi:MAG: response regulator transcription factor [Dehalococcoidales bacterium]|nr:response regulator transcription factor [Dehalococcoidales bacterium]